MSHSSNGVVGFYTLIMNVGPKSKEDSFVNIFAQSEISQHPSLIESESCTVLNNILIG